MPTLAGKNTFPSIFSLIGFVFSVFRLKVDVLNPSELNILFPRRHFVYKQNKVYSIIGKSKFFPIWEYEKINKN